MIRKKFSFLNKPIFLDIICIFVLSFFITCVSFCYVWETLEINRFFSYFRVKLFVLNYLPVLFSMTIIWLITKKIHWSFLLNALLILGFGIANQTKLIYRDDVIIFSDLTLIKEASLMSKQYDLVIKKYSILIFLLIIIIFILLRKYFHKLTIKNYIRIPSVFALLFLGFLSYKYVYLNDDLYKNLGDQSTINVWIQTRQYQIRGLLYPFIHSSKDLVDDIPENYNEKEIEELLSNYDYEDIPDDKKVNIIAIMLEAYNDFSKYNNLEFTEDIYSPLHKIQDKSISGHLITSVFGGGTSVTERNFLTGYSSLTSFRRKTNSFVWYLKEQGYQTEAMHPIYGAFYNRNTVNANLGFDEFYNYENKYKIVTKQEYLWNGYANDKYVFDSIKEGFEKSKNNNNPYFNFTVTYQNHGPYSGRNYDDKKYFIENKNYNEESYNIFNEYLTGIKETNENLEDLISYFEKEKEPVIVIFFGDHNPYLGNAYSDFNLNLDVSNLEGYINYYQTPYVIYGNDSAKKQFSKSFIGKSEDISPYFLMNELFEYLGFNGNEYNQYLSDLKKNIDVISDNFNKEDNEYILSTKSNYNDKIKEFKRVNYYWSRNFNK